MKAMVITGFGGPEVFEEREVPRPDPGPGEVLVKVHATSVNPIDGKVRRGGPWGVGVHPPAIIGYDVAGVVEASGPGVWDFKPGDEVYYTPESWTLPGSFAEYHVAREAVVARKPANLTFLEAASLPLAGVTALEALIGRARLQVGETVLIHAGAGGVGSLAIQIAKAAGARVFTTCRGDNLDLVRRLGADRAIDYTAEDFVAAIQRETGKARVDVVLDPVGGDATARSTEVMKPFGRMVCIVKSTADLGQAFSRNLTIYYQTMQRSRARLDHLRTLVEGGQVKPVIDSVLPLAGVAAAHERLERGGVRGKIVLEVVGKGG